MKLSLNWLRDFVDVQMPVSELARRLIDATAEVESWETIGAQWDPERIRVAEVVAIDPHPNADRLRLATVETGHGRQQVVCGAPNLAVGQKVAFATEGAELIDGHTGEPAKLKLRPIRGVESAGMVLSEKELGISDDHEGILVLPADAPAGRPLVGTARRRRLRYLHVGEPRRPPWCFRLRPRSCRAHRRSRCDEPDTRLR